MFKNTGSKQVLQVQLEIANFYTFPDQDRGLFAFLLAAVLTNALGPGAPFTGVCLVPLIILHSASAGARPERYFPGTQLTTSIFSPQRHRQQCRGPEAMLGHLACLNPALVAPNCDVNVWSSGQMWTIP